MLPRQVYLLLNTSAFPGRTTVREARRLTRLLSLPSLLPELVLPLRQLTHELLVSSRTQLPGYQGLVEDALLLM